MVKHFFRSAILSTLLLSSCLINSTTETLYKSGFTLSTSHASLSLSGQHVLGNMFYGANILFGINWQDNSGSQFALSQECKNIMNNPEEVVKYLAANDKLTFSGQAFKDVMSGKNLFIQEALQHGINNFDQLDIPFNANKIKWDEQDNRVRFDSTNDEGIIYNLLDKEKLFDISARAEVIKNPYNKWLFDNNMVGNSIQLAFMPEMLSDGGAVAHTHAAAAGKKYLKNTVAHNEFFGPDLRYFDTGTKKYVNSGAAGNTQAQDNTAIGTDAVAIVANEIKIKSSDFAEDVKKAGTVFLLKEENEHVDIRAALHAAADLAAVAGIRTLVPTADATAFNARKFNTKAVLVNSHDAHQDYNTSCNIMSKVFVDLTGIETYAPVYNKEIFSFSKEELEGNARFKVLSKGNRTQDDLKQEKEKKIQEDQQVTSLYKKAYNKLIQAKKNKGNIFDKLKVATELYGGYFLNDLFGLDKELVKVAVKFVFNPFVFVTGLMSNTPLADNVVKSGGLVKYADLFKVGVEGDYKFYNINDSFALNVNLGVYFKPLGAFTYNVTNTLKTNKAANTYISLDENNEFVPTSKVKDAFSRVAEDAKFERSAYDKFADAVEFRLTLGVLNTVR